MIACRFFFGVHYACEITRISAISKISNPIRQFKGRFHYHHSIYERKMHTAKDKQISVDHIKNRRIFNVNQVWRPACTRPCSSGDLAMDAKVLQGGENQVEEVTQHDIFEAEAVNNIIKSNIISEEREDEDRALTEDSIVSDVKHSASLEVSASLIRFIKGKGGSIQKKIEEELDVKIMFPSPQKEPSIFIEGSTVESVTKASEKIQAIINEAIKSPSLDYSHFVSLPLAIHPALVDKLVNFQNSTLGNSDDNPDEDFDNDPNENIFKDEDKDQKRRITVDLKVEDAAEHVKVDITNIPITGYSLKNSRSSTLSDLGIDKSIFIKPKTFHLTVLMLKLYNEERVNAAAEVLRSVSEKVMDALDSQPVSVRLKGLECMRGSVEKARVLYAPVEEIGSENRLMRACQIITNAFVEAGLVLERDAKQKLKLHATVMNARHRKRKKKWTRADSFDARGIMERYGSEDWGDYLIREAHLSQRFVFDGSGYYHCCASIPFPEI